MQAQRHDNAAFCDVHLNKHHCLLALRRSSQRQYHFPVHVFQGKLLVSKVSILWSSFMPRVLHLEDVVDGVQACKVT